MKHHKLFAALTVSSSMLLAITACSGESDAVKQDRSPTSPPPGSSSGGSGSSSGASGGSSTSSSSSSSSTGSSGASGSSGIADAGPDGPKENCVPKGYKGNDKKIGAYCDKDTACPFQASPFLICTGADDPTGVSQFCTSPCQEHSQCGTDAFCMHYPQGSGCVPSQCGGDATGKPKP